MIKNQETYGFHTLNRFTVTLHRNLCVTGTVYTHNRAGYGLPGHGYGVGNPDPRVTCDEP
jgi:hypothetical protein